MLELHIWGPAFGLPSIDVECLATVHYCQSSLPNESWCLVPSSNPNLNPFQQLPALRDDSLWVAGFDQIVQYLRDRDEDGCDLDGNLDNEQKADCDAYTAFVYSQGLPLLDLSLYVSSDNYTTTTRSALGDLLTWPQSWTIPHLLRDQARKRSDHLGLSALDVDAAQEDETGNAGLTAKIPKSLRKPKQTVSGLLGRTAQRTRFRLDAVTEAFLEPLHAKLAKRNWLVADRISSVDCLAIAVISLMQVPDVPQKWLREALSNKYSTLANWATTHASQTYGKVVSVSSVLKGNCSDKTLPWKAMSSPPWQETSMIAIETVVSSVPVLRAGYSRHKLPEQRHASDNRTESRQYKQQLYAQVRGQQRLYSQVLFASIGTTSVLGWMVYSGLLVLPYLWTKKPSRRSFGEAGALLGL